MNTESANPLESQEVAVKVAPDPICKGLSGGPPPPELRRGFGPPASILWLQHHQAAKTQTALARRARGYPFMRL
jgi:hypothetical protein